VASRCIQLAAGDNHQHPACTYQNDHSPTHPRTRPPTHQPTTPGQDPVGHHHRRRPQLILWARPRRRRRRGAGGGGAGHGATAAAAGGLWRHAAEGEGRPTGEIDCNSLQQIVFSSRTHLRTLPHHRPPQPPPPEPHVPRAPRVGRPRPQHRLDPVDQRGARHLQPPDRCSLGR
jgi:hypothetical protein